MKSLVQKPSQQSGYVLLTLMLFVALLAIGSLAWIEKVDFQMKRDREEELIHRGVQYSRAVRRYVKKLGRYPARIEDLEHTNNIRFLRKRYKDPITGKDFKLLHQTDILLSFSPGAASGLQPGSDADSGAQQVAGPGALNSPVSGPGGPGPSAIPGDAQPDSGGQNDTSQSDQSAPNNAAPTRDNQGFNGSGRGASPQPAILGASATQVNPQTFGGGAILGVASTSKDKSIRQFNKKDHYNQWQFIYDASTDRGGFITTPNQPQLQIATPINGQQNDQPGNTGQNQGFGFGQAGMNSSPQPAAPANPQQPNQQ